MKIKLIILFLINSLTISLAQNIVFNVNGDYKKTIVKEKLLIAKTLIDINSGYPSSWVDDTSYISSKIISTCDGIINIAMGDNDILNDKQKKILNIADIGTNIIVEVKYNFKNPITNLISVKTIDFSRTIISKIEAEYKGGAKKLNNYLVENILSKIPKTKQLKLAIVSFVINEIGGIIDVQMTSSTGDDKIDDLLLHTIYSMPKWIPAEDSKGKKHKQKFVCSMGKPGC